MIRAFPVQEGWTARVALIGGAFGAAAAAVIWASQTIAVKGLTGLAEIGVAMLAPLAAWLAWARPLIFPYGLYAIVAPFDVLMLVSKQDGTIARLVGLASAAALTFYIVRTREFRAPPRAIGWLAFLCGWMALSTLWSAGDDPWKESLTLLQIAGLYLAVACFPTRRQDMVPLLAMILLGGVIAAALGIYQFHAAGATTNDLQRLTVTVGHAQLDPNMYADSLLLPFAIALAWFARARRTLFAVGALGTMAILVMAIALAGSRDATIGLGIETLVLTTMLRAWKRVALPVTALIACTLVLFPNAILRAIADTGEGYGRTSIWHVGWAAFLQHPMIGSGADSFAAVYDQVYLRIFERYDVGWHMASHDLIVHYGVELGLIGLVLVLGWGISQWLLARALPRIGTMGDVRAICLASLAALTFAAFFIDLFDVKFVWLLFGLIAQARNVSMGGKA